MKTIIKTKYFEIPRFVNIKLGQKILQEKSDRLLPEESFCGRYADVVLYRVSHHSGPDNYKYASQKTREIK